jgi:hypothetical protein
MAQASTRYPKLQLAAARRYNGEQRFRGKLANNFDAYQEILHYYCDARIALR